MARPKKAGLSLRHERILRLWADGMTAMEIGARFMMTASGVMNVLARARQAGDPRAVRRGRNHNQRGRKHTGKNGAALKDVQANWMALRARQNRCARAISGIEEMQQILAASDVPVTRCPPGWHMGHVPECLKA